MSAWDIDPDGVGSVLQSVGGMIGGEDGGGGLVATTASVGEGLTYASSCANSSPISYALQGFLEAYGAKAGAMTAKSVSAVVGCGEATTAYINGDLEMATEAQSGAGHVSDLNL
ncbi:DUF6507 family protein [Nocardiopsis rhodophaea]|uniref:DUF6507 family protein n=1 Tax=Nocardiopsis rhodophaea TaxID=280238 RepID=UPI0031CFA54D